MKWLFNWAKPSSRNLLDGYVTRDQLTSTLQTYATLTSLNNYLLKTGGTLTGALTIKQASGNAGIVTNTSTWNSKHFVSTKYSTNTSQVDDNNTLLKIEVNTTDNNSTIKGTNLTISGLVAPTSNTQPATKQYVDDALRNHQGNSNVDLSNYVTNSALTTQLGNYVTNSALTTQLGNYVTKNNPVLNSSNGNPVKITCAASNPSYVEFVRNNTNGGYIGLGSSSHNNMMIGCRNGSVQIAPSNNQVDVSNSRIINVATPTQPNDAVNKKYLNDLLFGVSVPQIVNVKVRTNNSLNISSGGVLTINLSDLNISSQYSGFNVINISPAGHGVMQSNIGSAPPSIQELPADGNIQVVGVNNPDYNCNFIVKSSATFRNTYLWFNITLFANKLIIPIS